MKARVKKTDEIVEIYTFVDTEENEWLSCHLDFLEPIAPDYWTRLEHQAAIAAMQGMLSNPAFPKYSQEGYYKKNVVNNAYEYAHTLVEKYKKEVDR